MEERTEFGFKRTFGDGPFERLNCKYIPGFLVPADLDRMARAMNFLDTQAWAMQYLLASPGALVRRIDPKTGRSVDRRIRTLVPARQAETGHCVHFNVNGRCDVHPVAPYGCAFFDCNQSDKEASHRSMISLIEIEKNWDEKGQYAQIWEMLDAAGKRSPSPEESRQNMKKGFQRLIRKGYKE